MRALLKALGMITLTVALSFSAHASRGNEGSGGGDLRAMQFVKIAEKVADYLEHVPDVPPVLKKIDIAALKKAIKTTAVESTDEVLLLPSGESTSAVTKDALNWPAKKRIVFNREAWDMIPSGSKRAALVLHEYLGIMSVDDKDYGYSRQLFENGTLKMIFDYIPETQSITEGLDFNFSVKCTIDYQGTHIDEFSPLGWRKSADGKFSSYGGLIGRILTYNDKNEALQLFIYNENDWNMELIKFPHSNEDSIHIVLGWDRDTFFQFPRRIVFEQKVKLTPNFKTEMTFPDLGLKFECHRMLKQELDHEPFYIPVEPVPQK
ncbi:MAG: hypothetical protein ACJ763_07950 [Bdellovibrionia bacterium]